MIVAGLSWRILHSDSELTPVLLPATKQVINQPHPENELSSVSENPIPTNSFPTSKQPKAVARVIWSRNRNDLLRSVSIETTRGEAHKIDLSLTEPQIILSFPQYDNNGQRFSRYQIGLIATRKNIWRQILIAPKLSLNGTTHTLHMFLFRRHLPKSDEYRLVVEGDSVNGWEPIGHMILIPGR